MDNYYENLIQGKARAAAKKIEEKDPEFAEKLRSHLAPIKEKTSEAKTEDANPTPCPQLKITKGLLQDAASHEKSLKRGVPPEDQ